MLRSSKVHYKSSDLYSILSLHFSEKMNKARLKVMSMMICALCKVQQVAYTKLAAAFDSEALAASSLRRIQRLIAECVIDTDLIARLILKLIPVKGRYNLSMDRTNWKYSDTNINILNLGVIYDGMAFPVIYTMMDKRGNSNTAERIELIERFIRLAGEDSIDNLMADREFVGDEWFGYLNSKRIHYHIRILQYRRLACQRSWTYVKSAIHHHDCLCMVLPRRNLYSRKHQTDKGLKAWKKGCQSVQVWTGLCLPVPRQSP